MRFDKVTMSAGLLALMNKCEATKYVNIEIDDVGI